MSYFDQMFLKPSLSPKNHTFGHITALDTSPIATNGYIQLKNNRRVTLEQFQKIWESSECGQMHRPPQLVTLKITKSTLSGIFTMGPGYPQKVGNQNSALANGCEGSGQQPVFFRPVFYRKCMDNSEKRSFLDFLPPKSIYEPN